VAVKYALGLECSKPERQAEHGSILQKDIVLQIGLDDSLDMDSREFVSIALGLGSIND